MNEAETRAEHIDPALAAAANSFLRRPVAKDWRCQTGVRLFGDRGVGETKSRQKYQQEATMTLSAKECQESAMMLPLAERAALTARLIESLDELDETENEQLWVEESERRYQAYKQGSLSARTATDAIERVRARLR